MDKKVKDLFIKPVSKRYREEEVRDAKNWFKEKIKEVQGQSLKNVDMSDLRYRGKTPLVGSMTAYFYKAKYDGVLPYWDRYPLSIMIDENSTHMMGLNLHYLPPKLRGALLTRLMDVVSNDRFDEKTKLNASYSLLKSASKYKYFRPCLKLYIKKNVKSNIMIIRPSQWHRAIFLPVARFVGASQATVWAESKGKF